MEIWKRKWKLCLQAAQFEHDPCTRMTRKWESKHGPLRKDDSPLNMAQDCTQCRAYEWGFRRPSAWAILCSSRVEGERVRPGGPVIVGIGDGA